MSSMEATTLPDDPALTQLEAQFTGRILRQGDDGYIGLPFSPTGPPAFIAKAATTDDVVRALAFARSTGAPLTLRSGGHSGGSCTTAPGGFVLDLSALDTIEVLSANRVRLGSGALWGDVAHSLSRHGLALSSGDTTSVGIGGLTLGGGIGWLVRKHGLTLDSLLSAEVVTATGESVTASAQDHPDLFWALRGGGGNFGVVTHFTFQAHPLLSVVAGSIACEAGDDVAPLLRAWRDVMRTAPEELTTTFQAMPAMGPDMPATTQILVCFAGHDESVAMAAIDPLLGLPGVTGHDIRRKDYADVLETPHPPDVPLTIISNNGFAPAFSDDCIDAVATVQRELGGAVLMIRGLTGAVNRVPSDATAFAFRDSEVLIISAAFFPPDAPAEAVERVGRLWGPVASHLQGSYGNFMTTGGDDAVARMYPPATLARLAEVKRRYDPGNLFNQNQNIRPAG